MQSASQQLETAIIAFLNHKQFDRQGRKQFQSLQRKIIAFSHHHDSLYVFINALSHSQNHQPSILTSLLLKDKLKYEFDQLDLNTISQTHQQLVNLIRNKYKKTQKVILINLTLCLVYIYMHCASNLGNILDYLRYYFESDQQYSYKFLELIPEEINDKAIVIDEEGRNQAKQILLQSQTDVLISLHQANPTTEESITCLLKTFANWIQFHPNPLFENQLQNHSLLKLTFQSLSDHSINEQAAKTLGVIVSVLKGVEENEPVFNYVGQNIFRLLDQIPKHMSVHDYEMVETYVKVLCDFGIKAAYKFILKFDQNIKKYIFLLIELIKIQEIQVFFRLIDFWETFLFAIKRKHKNSLLDEKSQQEIIEKLYFNLCVRIKYKWADFVDMNYQSQLMLKKTKKCVEDKYDQREAALFLFDRIADILGQQQYMLFVFRMIELIPQQSQHQTWLFLDSFLFSLTKTLHQYPSVSHPICQIVALFEKLKSKFVLINKQFLSIFQCLFEVKQKNIDFIMKLFSSISQLFSNQILMDKAVKAFSKGCRLNSQFIRYNVKQFMVLVKNYPNEKSILQGITLILGHYPEAFQKYLPELLEYPFAQISNPQIYYEQKKKSLQAILGIVKVLGDDSSSSINTVLVQLMKQLWPVIRQILEYPLDVKGYIGEGLVEKTIKILKIIMRRIPSEFITILPQILGAVMNSYGKYPISSYLYLFEIMVTVYGRFNSDVVDYLIQVFVKLFEITFYYVDFGNTNFNQYQYLIYDFLGMNLRIVIYNSCILFKSGKLFEILEFCLNCLASDIPILLSSACQVFESVFMVHWTPYSRQKYKNAEKGEVVHIDSQYVSVYNEIKIYLEPFVPKMIGKLLGTLKNSPSQLCRNTTLDCLSAAILAYPQTCYKHWQTSLGNIDEDILTKSQKNKFMHALINLNTNNHSQFLTAEVHLTKYLQMIANREIYKQSRQTNGITI